ncbi:hypothetical protein [Streptomyces sp. CA-253872]|uniref:hypothetical protein n=1 Tax=Streptomyces sp. CA-253872 TaxID=3240067 RepID=UPI003D8B4253
MPISATSPVRLARPSLDLRAAEEFSVTGLGLGAWANRSLTPLSHGSWRTGVRGCPRTSRTGTSGA